jgi:hypothetical protein
MEKRLRSVFTLKSLKTNQAVDALKGCMWFRKSVNLLIRSIGWPICTVSSWSCLCDGIFLFLYISITSYNMQGQMQNAYAAPYLVETLENENLHPMVRHEVHLILPQPQFLWIGRGGFGRSGAGKFASCLGEIYYAWTAGGICEEMSIFPISSHLGPWHLFDCSRIDKMEAGK